jgi:hypothetical protein
MDIHEVSGATAADVAKAHIADVKTQGKYGVVYHKYWLNESSGKIFCLCSAPNPEAAWQLALEHSTPEHLICVTGSFYLAAEIRAAIPLRKVADPKQTLASAPIKSVWGDTLGKVRDVDMNGSNIKTVDAVVGGKGAVKIDASHLKYVRSRNLLVTTFSKEDAAKLPKADPS